MLVWLLQSAPPDTVGYLALGYAIIGGVGVIYVVSLLVRQRGLRRDLEVIERLRAEDED